MSNGFEKCCPSGNIMIDYDLYWNYYDKMKKEYGNIENMPDWQYEDEKEIDCPDCEGAGVDSCSICEGKGR